MAQGGGEVTEKEVALLIRDAVKESGSLRALGKKWKVSAQYLCDLIHGRRIAGPAILKAMKLKRLTTVIRDYSKAAGK